MNIEECVGVPVRSRPHALILLVSVVGKMCLFKSSRQQEVLLYEYAIVREGRSLQLLNLH